MEIVGNKTALPSLNKLPRIKQTVSLIGPKPITEKSVENNLSLRVANDAEVGCSPLPPLIQSRNLPPSLLENIKSHQTGPENSGETNMKKSVVKVSRGRETENFNRRISRVIKNVSVKKEGVESENPTSCHSLGPLKPKTALKSLDLNEGVKAMIKIQEAKPEKEEQNDISVCENLEVKKKKKKKILTALKDMVPLNLNEEKQTFFNLSGNYNPVFQYRMEDLNQKFSQAHTSHLGIAEKILQECIKEFGDDENYIEISGGKLSIQADIEARFAEYIKELGLEKYLKLAFSDKIVIFSFFDLQSNSLEGIFSMLLIQMEG